MRFAVKSLAIATVLGVAACNPPPPVQQDTGNMAFPTPLPQGNISTTQTVGRGTPDTGNMAYPTPQPQGTISTTRTTGRGTPDTGNMAYPTPQPQGNYGTTRAP